MQEQKTINIEKRSISEQVFINIKRMILSGTIQVGGRILEDEISKVFGVSRTPVRETLKKLESYGLIVIKPRSHAHVIRIDDEEMNMIASVRANIECFAVKIIAERHSALSGNTIQLLDTLITECEESLPTKNPVNIFEKDSSFHLELAHCTGNHYVYEILEKLDAKIQLYRLAKCVTYEKMEKAVMQHREIVSAAVNGDAAKAERLMYRHVYSN